MPAATDAGGREEKIVAHPATTLVLLVIAAAVILMGCFPALLQNWIASFYVKL